MSENRFTTASTDQELRSQRDVQHASVSSSPGVTADDTPPVTEGPFSFAVSIESFPYLADHGFQDMIVLPGSFYVDMALCLHTESLRASLGTVRRVEFRNPVILAERPLTLNASIRRLDGKTVAYTIQEAGGLPCALLEIQCDDAQQPHETETAFSVEAFQRRAVSLGDQSVWYRRLRENGNQYGPQFQTLKHVWRAGPEALGRLSVPGEGTRPHHLHPLLTDGLTQLLACFFLEQRRTFVLQGIEEIAMLRPVLPCEGWVHGRLRQQDRSNSGGWTGDVEAFDDSGACSLKLRGVRFTYLDRLGPQENVEAAQTPIVVAATFTAEPVEDALRFWGDFLGFPVRASFAPYNQVFQELLNPDSQFRRNPNGLNAILLNLEDWARVSGGHRLTLEPDRAAACFGDLRRQTLPNGLEVAHLNRHETEYVYREVFEDQCYLRHGIRLPDDATVIDIGANIGLFSLFVRSRCSNASVYAFEPSPVAFQALQANCAAYGPGLHPFNVGVSDRRGSAALTFYEKSSVFSSFHPSAVEDRQAIEAVVANIVRGELGDTAESVDGYVQELMTDRLKRLTFECPLMSVSDIIRENSLRRVDLLKVDAEKSELEILRGIEDGIWPIIEQVVVEVHDRSGRALREVTELLARQGFQCAVEEENLLKGSGLFNLYATRNGNASPSQLERTSVQSPTSDVRARVDQFVEALDSFTRAADTPTVVCLCPPALSTCPRPSFDEIAASQRHLRNRLCELPRVEVIDVETILARYPTPEFHDPHGNDLGHMPFTPEGFAAIGSSLFRKFVALQHPPYKVIVLDCDNTLWHGACGEEGPLGVEVTPAHRALHEFVLRQMGAGMLLCLCSKNNEADVWAVFAQHPGMTLKREHLAAWRINWAPKSENLRSLARELNLGLESIIFLDDNPAECAEVRANCPDVLTLQLPPEADRVPQFLDHIWAFDQRGITEEDRTRTQKVLENVQRERYRGQAATLKDFIDGLQLRVDLFEPVREQMSRVSQLTLRTNQFNFSAIRRSEGEVLRFLENEGGRCLVAKVSDRFGDYGLVGLLFYRDGGEGYDVDTFLLSCRVLGRGVEHQILAQFARQAMTEGKKWVELPFHPTNKNEPAWNFIQSVGAGCRRETDNGSAFRLPASRLADLRYSPDQPSIGVEPRSEDAMGDGAKADPLPAPAIPALADKFQRIADRLTTLKEICAAIEAYRLRSAGGGNLDATELPATLAGKMLGIWRRVMGSPRIGMNDNFVDVGGTSLRAVQIIAAIRRELRLQASIVNIFECPTVRLLCEKLQPGKASGGSASEAMERGARRKDRARRRA